MSTSTRPMYDMYPAEWGPANHDPDNARSREALQASFALRDNGADRPDDN